MFVDLFTTNWLVILSTAGERNVENVSFTGVKAQESYWEVSTGILLTDQTGSSVRGCAWKPSRFTRSSGGGGSLAFSCFPTT